MVDKDIKAVWVATVPRTGSMWTFNVIRDLVRSAGVPALPEIVPHDDAEMEALGRQGIDRSDGIHVLKVHTAIPPDLPSSLYVVTHRDIRDSVVSFMRFTQSGFDAGLRFAAGAIRLEHHFSQFPKGRTLNIDFERIVTAPTAATAEISKRLGIDANPELIGAIVDRYSKRSVQARIAETEQALRGKIEAREAVDRRDFIPQSDHSLRAFDKTTGFQSGHVSDYREGDWRSILSPEQQTALENLIAEGRVWQARQSEAN